MFSDVLNANRKASARVYLGHGSFEDGEPSNIETLEEHLTDASAGRAGKPGGNRWMDRGFHLGAAEAEGGKKGVVCFKSA